MPWAMPACRGPKALLEQSSGLERIPSAARLFHQRTKARLGANAREERFVLREERVIDDTQLDHARHRIQRGLGLTDERKGVRHPPREHIIPPSGIAQVCGENVQHLLPIAVERKS